MDTITVEGFAKQREQLERLLTTSPQFAKDVEDVVRMCLRELRKRMSDTARAGLMRSDPRQAYKAVRMAVYRQIIGGNVNILSRRSAGSGGNYSPTRTLVPGQRGGNRRPRSADTERMDGYMGADRGFILRFLNSGTDTRSTRYGNRGRIKERGWFESSASSAMNQTADEVAKLIDSIIEERLT